MKLVFVLVLIGLTLSSCAKKEKFSEIGEAYYIEK